MRPAQGGDGVSGNIAFVSPFGDGAGCCDGIPVDDDRRQQIQPGDPVMRLSGSITDFT